MMKKRMSLLLLVVCLTCALLQGTALAADGVEALTYEVPGTNIVLFYQVKENETVNIIGCNEAASGVLEIPSSIDGKEITEIGEAAFQCCEVTEVSIPDSVTSIGIGAFKWCIYLTHIRLPDSITVISNDMFYECWELTDLLIPDTVTTIGDGAFMDCDSLTTINIPKSVNSIDPNYVFCGCASLNAIDIEEGNPCFRKVGHVLYSKDMSRLVVSERDIEGICAIPDSVQKIDSCAFDECVGLTEITLPDSVAEIGEWAFSYCSLTSIVLPDSITEISRGMLSNCVSLTNVTIPNSVTTVGSRAFENCIGLTNIMLPSSVMTIEESAFYNCTSFTEIVLPDSVITIGEWTFSYCSNLAGIVIPDSVTSIGNGAFWDCSNLKAITIPKSVTSVGKRLFGNNLVGKEITIYGYPGTAAEAYATEDRLHFVPITEPCTDHAVTNIWSYDASEHWHNCMICGEKLDSVSHIFGAWKITKAATAAAEGKRERVCDICGYKQTETIPAMSNGIIGSPVKWNGTNVYGDVPAGAWYRDAVTFVTEKGLMSGTGTNTFAPDDNLTRAMLVQILYNHEGKPATSGNDFTDVQSGAWYADAITWAAQKGIVSGYGTGEFGPDDNLTREQLTAILWRYAGQPTSNASLNNFTDIDKASDYAHTALQWAVENGIIRGKGDGILNPTGDATRGEAAQMLMNYFKNTV